MKALIDSGASISVLSTSMLQQPEELISKCVESTKSMIGIGSSRIAIEATLVTELKVGNTQFEEVKFAVVEEDKLPVDAILGMNFLHGNNIILDLGKGKLIHDTQEEQLLCKYARQQPRDIPAYVLKEVRVPPRCQIVVQLQLMGKVEPNQLLFIEPIIDPRSDGGIVSGRAVCENKLGVVKIPVMNIFFTEATLREGQVLAKVSQLAPTAVKLEEEETIEAGFTCALIEENDRQTKRQLEGFYDLDHITEGKAGLVELINRYPEVTSKSSYDIGTCTLPPMEIETGEAEPIRIPPRRMGPRQRENIRKHVMGMAEAGILSESDSGWSFPLVPVAKRDGDIRPCVDFHLLNEI